MASDLTVWRQWYIMTMGLDTASVETIPIIMDLE